MDIFNIICGVITIISFAVTIFFGMKSSKLEKALRKMEWSDVLSAVDLLWFQLRKDNYIPDVILSPGLRGCFFAELLVNKMGHDIPVLVGSSIIEDKKNVDELNGYTKIPVREDWNIFIPDIVFRLQNAKILIVDDFTLSGQFPVDLKKQLFCNGIRKENVKSFYAVITTVTKSKGSIPDYYWKEVSDDNFYFPWGKANMG